MTNEKVARIRALNDRLRRTGVGGMIMQTSGVHDLGEDTVRSIAQAVMKFDDFTANNDRIGEGLVKSHPNLGILGPAFQRIADHGLSHSRDKA